MLLDNMYQNRIPLTQWLASGWSWLSHRLVCPKSCLGVLCPVQSLHLLILFLLSLQGPLLPMVCLL